MPHGSTDSPRGTPSPRSAQESIRQIDLARSAIAPHVRGTNVPILVDSGSLMLFVVGMGLFLDGLLVGVALLAVAVSLVVLLPVIRRNTSGFVVDLFRHRATRVLGLIHSVLVVAAAGATIWLYATTGNVWLLIGGAATAAAINILLSFVSVHRIRASLRSSS